MSEETKWTKGPWVALPIKTRLTGMANQPLFDDGRWVVLPEDDTERLPLAEVDHGDDQYEPARKQAEYDAHLIAAAPEMADAIQWALAVFGPDTPEHAAILEAMHSALAKARGES